ncbi:hypothetical protein Cantr_05920 [Candida viswanathii]|uniref:Lysine acetyltransferase n=1 Tax=Candida viswanathii TaxID=5486 RepID=A0A367XSM8_9ASCO|nr:hypothetical protein Cantr_05920 [Candida viswanathii]
MPSSIQPEQFELVHLTDKEIIEFTRTQNAQSWKGALSTKDYVLREHVLGKSRMASTPPNQLLVFMLRRISDLVPLCSIELLVRKSKKFVYEEGEVEEREVLSGCIGGVYTYPEHRGHGYARIMVDKLVGIAREIIGQDGFIFLYSEIGEYYAKNGFKSFGVDLINVPLLDGATVDAVGDEKHDFVNYHEFDSLMAEYTDQFESSVVAKVTQDKITRIAVVPDPNIIDWFHLRSKYISYKLFYEADDMHPIDFDTEPYEEITSRLTAIEPQKFGIRIYQDDKVVGFIVWTMDYLYETNENYVTVLKVVSFDKDNRDANTIKLLKLMKNYLLEQPTLGMKTSKIVIWESEISQAVKQFLVDEWKSKTGIDNPSRSAILMNNPKEDEQLRQGQVIWEGNDKLPWF